MQRKKQKLYLIATRKKDKIMPSGKGTYGSKKGRPPMKKNKKTKKQQEKLLRECVKQDKRADLLPKRLNNQLRQLRNNNLKLAT